MQTSDSKSSTVIAPVFRDWIQSGGGSPFPPEPGRYHLHLTPGCQHSHRVLMVIALQNLKEIISWSPLPEPPEAREAELHKIIRSVVPGYNGELPALLLWDKKSEAIVSAESLDIIRMLESELGPFSTSDVKLCPQDLRAQVDKTIDRVILGVVDGINNVGYSMNQTSYEASVTRLFLALDEWDLHLEMNRFLCGDFLTLADLCFFPVLTRMETIFSPLYKCSVRGLRDYKNLWAYARDICQMPGVSESCQFEESRRFYYLSEKRLNPSGIVPLGPDPDWLEPQDRKRRYV